MSNDRDSDNGIYILEQIISKKGHKIQFDPKVASFNKDLLKKEVEAPWKWRKNKDYTNVLNDKEYHIIKLKVVE